MLERAPQPCLAPGCRFLVQGGGRCQAHRRAEGKAVDRARGSASSRGYGAHHRQWRVVILARDPLCVACLAVGRVTPSRVADHVLPVSWGGEWTEENGQGLCDGTTGEGCHDVKRAHERQGRIVRVVQGEGLVVVGVHGERRGA